MAIKEMLITCSMVAALAVEVKVEELKILQYIIQKKKKLKDWNIFD